MTRVKASCPDCSDVELDVEDIGLSLYQIGPVVDWPRCRYAFTCPKCGQRASKPCPQAVYAMLVQAGAIPSRVRVPAEAVEDHHGAPLTWDDVLDFALALERADADAVWLLIDLARDGVARSGGAS